MISMLLIAWALAAFCVIIHTAGMMGAFQWVSHQRAMTDFRFWPSTWLLIRITAWFVAVHLLEIAVWAIFYWRKGCFEDAETAFYFAGVTYTTLGYGDMVLPREWRMLGPIEGLTGILMCGLSTGFFVAVVGKMFVLKLKDEVAPITAVDSSNE